MSAAIDFSQPPTVELGRTPSQPSLTHSSTTVSDDNSTARPRIPMTPPMPSSLSGDVSDEHDRAARDLDRWSPSPPPVRETFTEKAAKRLSLSKSLQSLREKAKSDKARRRASSLSEKFKPPPIPTDLPPVPSIPAMYKTEASITGLGVASAPVQQQQQSPSFPHLQQRRGASNPGPSIPTDARSTAGPSGTSTKPTRKERGLSVFFKKITGRSKKEPLPGYTRRQHHNTMAEPVGSIGRRSSRMPEAIGSFGRRTSRQPVPVPTVAAPARVRGVLAEMESSSAAIQRRHSARKSMIKRVPVPIYNPDIDEMKPIADPNDIPAPMDSPVKAADAAEARAAALAALEGGSSSRPSARPVPPRRSPSPCPRSQPQHAASLPDSEAPVTPPVEAVDMFQLAGIKHEEEDQQEREAHAPLLSLPTPTADGETDAEEPVIKSARMPSPIVTQVVVMEPQDVADVGNEHAPALCPSMKIVSRRSFSGPPSINTSFGVVGGSLGRRLPKGRKKLSDFGAFEPDAEAAEGADVVRPLQLRIPLACSSATAATFGPCTDSNSLRTPNTPVSATSSTFHFDHASQGGCGGAGASSVGHGSVDTTGPSSFARQVPGLGSAAGHGSCVGHSLDSQPPSPRTPMSVNSHYSPSESHSLRDPRFAGSSPARVAAIGDGLILGSSDSHSRPSSRLRSAGSRLGRKLSTKPKEPPTSHDACVEKQRELAMRRQSCRPTLHSNASIAAELREVRDKADKDTYDTMETFFMS